MPGRISTLVFENINESNLSRFLRFEIWQGAERLRAFLMKVEIDGLPETRVSRILRSIINSRDRFFEYFVSCLPTTPIRSRLALSRRHDRRDANRESGKHLGHVHADLRAVAAGGITFATTPEGH